MKKLILSLAAIIIVIVVVAGGFLGYTAMNTNQPTSSPTPSITPEPITQEEARETVIMYIGSNHNETAALTEGITWTGGRATPEGLVGYETYIYTGNGWNVTVGNPVIPDPTYDVSATYTANGKLVLDWQGVYSHGEVNEMSFCYNP